MASNTRTKAPYQCPLLMSPDDVKTFREANVNLAELITLMKEVKDMTVDNHHTLRGHNGDPGMIAQFSTMDQRLNDMAAQLEALKEVPSNLANLKLKVDALKDVPEAVEIMRRYPSLTWLAAHKLKHMAIITAVFVTATIMIGWPDPARGESLRQLIELLFAKWLRL